MTTRSRSSMSSKRSARDVRRHARPGTHYGGQRTNDIMRVLTFHVDDFHSPELYRGVTVEFRYRSFSIQHARTEVAIWVILCPRDYGFATASALLVFFYRKGWLKRNKTR